MSLSKMRAVTKVYHLVPKILSPVNSYEGAIRVINAGADEIYCGVAIPGRFRNFILYRGPGIGKAQLPTYEELAKIVKYARKHNVKVMLTFNEPFMTEALEKDMMNHIRLCLDMGVDGLMIGDLGVLSLVKDMGVDVPLIASTYFVTMNSESVDFLRKIGFSRVVLERQLTIQEIFDVVTNSKIDIEIFCHGAGCSNINGNCYLYHYDTSAGLGLKARARFHTSKMIRDASPCIWHYEIYDINTKERIGMKPILDALTECSLCYLSMLVKAGVAGIKIVGRLTNAIYQEKITEAYRKLLDMIERQATDKSLQTHIKFLRKGLTPYYAFLEFGKVFQIPESFFQGAYCQNRRCYYSPLFDVCSKHATIEK